MTRERLEEIKANQKLINKRRITKQSALINELLIEIDRLILNAVITERLNNLRADND